MGSMQHKRELFNFARTKWIESVSRQYAPRRVPKDDVPICNGKQAPLSRGNPPAPLIRAASTLPAPIQPVFASV